jgi:hypothetical protein
LSVELEAMQVLRVERLAEYREQQVRVSGFSTIRQGVRPGGGRGSDQLNWRSLGGSSME